MSSFMVFPLPFLRRSPIARGSCVLKRICLPLLVVRFFSQLGDQSLCLFPSPFPFTILRPTEYRTPGALNPWLFFPSRFSACGPCLTGCGFLLSNERNILPQLPSRPSRSLFSSAGRSVVKTLSLIQVTPYNPPFPMISLKRQRFLPMSTASRCYVHRAVDPLCFRP